MDVRIFYVQYSTVFNPIHVHKYRLVTDPDGDDVGQGLGSGLDLDLA